VNLVFASGFLFPQTILHLDYFRGLPARYPEALFPGVPVDGHIRERAPVLAQKISERFPIGDIHVIAHSMGGLDTRYLLCNNLQGLASRIVSLSTVSTPHRGSPVADLLLGLLPGIDAAPVRAVLNSFRSVRAGALDDLTTTFAVRFNNDNPNLPNVRYYSYFGFGNTSLVLKPTTAFIRSRGNTDEERTNDGVVSLASAKWPVDLVEPPWTADHLAQVGHNLDTLDLLSPFDHKAAFDRIIHRATSGH
jgi:triacylglycerol lipase